VYSSAEKENADREARRGMGSRFVENTVNIPVDIRARKHLTEK